MAVEPIILNEICLSELHTNPIISMAIYNLYSISQF